MIPFLACALLLLVLTLGLLLPPLFRQRTRTTVEGGEAGGEMRGQLNLAVLRAHSRDLDLDLQAGRLDPASHAAAREELQRRVLEESGTPPATLSGKASASRWAGIVVGIAVPVLAAALYVLAGTPMALVPVQDERHAPASSEVEAMVAGLAERLKANPDNVEGWQMLVRSYNVMGRHREASEAYAELVKRVPNDARVYADYADTLAMAQGRTLLGEPERLIDKAIALDPGNLKALALSGSAAFERKDFARAIAVWEKLMRVAPADSDVAQSTAESIAHARRLLKEQGGKAAG
ncbi:c-type cytochrome biogenesis protein CcmI [Noviherbaspirillum galbum]|uniref:C-type cytochrome biogenesis protein CcmI n=1 Tax=Noviherbaspirillum galbum TaxID=2709383 RepID=A0A6B3SLA4_9BURK|nr:c-type cytochrome biogenesis protein CcmI [Noviherbaspirillum galbum]NEX61583.1 c-type cytochrome biogenesis protein CcmI [Noviherbaspirillum galbum]